MTIALALLALSQALLVAYCVHLRGTVRRGDVWREALRRRMAQQGRRVDKASHRIADAEDEIVKFMAMQKVAWTAQQIINEHHRRQIEQIEGDEGETVFVALRGSGEAN